jgi:hypothetical protein
MRQFDHAVRWFALLITAASCSCRPAATDEGRSSPTDIELAEKMLKEISTEPRFRLGSSPGDIKNFIDASGADKGALNRGARELLKAGDAERRANGVILIGYLADKDAVPTILEAANDPDESVRACACQWLGWLGAKKGPAAPTLVRLRREDPSVKVRVAAALAIGRPEDSDAVEAFRKGLLDPDTRDVSEDRLEAMGKLRLPLPDSCYGQISRAKLDKMRSNEHFYRISRETRVGSTLYVETMEGPGVDGIPFSHRWYRVTD